MNQYISMRQELVKSYTKIEASNKLLILHLLNMTKTKKFVWISAQVKIAKYLPEKEMIEMKFKKLEKENERLEEECNTLKRTRDRVWNETFYF